MRFSHVERGQFIEKGFPKKVGYFLNVYDQEGNYMGSGQMVGYRLNPAMLILEKRVAHTSSLNYKLLGLETERIMIKIPFSEIGGVELEPTVQLEGENIFFIEPERITSDRSVKIGSYRWNPDRCAPLQAVRKIKGWLVGENPEPILEKYKLN